MIKHILLNPLEHRLRTGWRILLFVIIIFTVGKSLRFLIDLLGGPPENKPLSTLFRDTYIIIGTTISVYISRRFIDKKSFKSLGFNLNKKCLVDLLFGFMVSGIIIGLTFIIMYLLGYIEILSIGYKTIYLNTFLTMLVGLISLGVTASWMEELIFRGYVMQNLKDGLGLLWAIIISSVIFGFVHILNPNSSILSSLIIVMITTLFVLGWLRTGELWIAFGLHAGWNFFEGPVFGFPVSGIVNNGYINQITSGPKWITGCDFGPEGGILIIPFLIIGFILIMYMTRSRKDTPWNQFLQLFNKSKPK